jgi:outer membrane biogenesis lipoprotein LolB
MRSTLVFLVCAVWLLAACGVKASPRPPKPQPPAQNSHFDSVSGRTG